MSFFVTKADGAYSLTTAGYVAVAVILVALIVVAALFAKREKKEKKKMRKEENYIFFSGMQQVWERPAPCWILLRN